MDICNYRRTTAAIGDLELKVPGWCNDLSGKCCKLLLPQIEKCHRSQVTGGKWPCDGSVVLPFFGRKMFLISAVYISSRTVAVTDSWKKKTWQ
jgi:hypothetical protein